MARIPESDLQRLKEAVSVERLVEASGVELKKAGKDKIGRCPFHADDEASLVVTGAKNLWHCFGCQIGGGPIDWVMKHRGVSFRHAVELLRADPSLAAVPAAPVRHATVRTLASPVAMDADDRALLKQTIDYYHQRLKESPEALAYLAARGLDHPGLVDAFQLGVADRTLGLRLPQKNRKDGEALRERLQRLGIIRESGHEHFNGSLVAPVFDEEGAVVEVYGRKIRDDLRPGTPKHLYLPGPHAGVFNLEGIKAAGGREPGSREVILCEALIDAMTFWCSGFTNVTSSFGVEGFTADILAALKAHGIERVLIAYDRDDAGERAAAKLAEELIAEGFEVLRILFPKGMDANEYAQKMSPADKALALVVRQAEWLGSGRKMKGEEAAKEENAAEPEAAQALPSLAAQRAAELAPLPPLELVDEVHLDTESCAWRVRGWKKNTAPEAMRVNVQVRINAAALDVPGYHLDTLDLYAARSRAAFARQASIELGLSEESVKRELGAVLLKLETMQDELITQAREQFCGAKVPILGAEEEAEALELLRAPDLIERIVADLHAQGVVGEDMNLLAAYLAAVSRKLDAPLAILIQSSSAAGKSALMDAVLKLVPEEDRVRYSAMTGQSLFYLGETNLEHRILAIAEEEGVRQAAYALKLLQSDGELTIASTAKDDAGNLTTRQYTVRGPVMLMLTTTAIDVDEELLNRCLVLTVNESAEQTRAIHARQRRRQTLEGLLQGAETEAIGRLHHNAQRLLAPIAVVNSYAERLSFAASRTRTRRDHMKYLTLIRSIALLHQHQREVKSVEHRGQAIAYIEVTRADIELANQVAHEVLGRTLDELPPQTRRLLNLIGAHVRERAMHGRIKPADVRFTRRDVREATGWSDNQLKVHCARLADMEFLLVHGGSRGHSLTYELAWDGREGDAARHLCGLIDPRELDAADHGYDERKLDREASKLRPSWPQVGHLLDGLGALQTRVDVEVPADQPFDGSRPHARATSSLAAVVAAS